MRFELMILATSYMIQVGNTLGPENLDKDGNYKLNWYFEKDKIVIAVRAKTLGWVGFGISPHGEMKGADIFIAGVKDDGTPYSSDRFGTFSSDIRRPKVDFHSDWSLLSYSEEEGETHLEFTRHLDTCDDEDYPIKNGTNRLIWAMGLTDKFEYHTSSRRGSKSLVLLVADDMPISVQTTFQPLITKLRYRLNMNITLPAEETTYWCSFHKGPKLPKRHYIIGFDPIIPNRLTQEYVHQLILYNCDLDGVPASTFLRFDNLTVDSGFNGSFCFKPHDEVRVMFRICHEHFYAWAKGGEKVRFPRNIGFPIQEAVGRNQYFMLEIHFSNQQKREGVNIHAGVDIVYTAEPMKHEADLLLVGYDTHKSVGMIIPPNTKDFVVVGHCSPGCTVSFPDDGITVFGSLFHSHNAGRKFKLRHFRNGTELEWLDVDENYDVNYQEAKMLMHPRKVMPGDQLSLECTYDSTSTEGRRVLIGGLSTHQETCQAYLFHYPKLALRVCTSSNDVNKTFLDLGITDYNQIDSSGFHSYFINKPENLRGSLEDSLSDHFNWTHQFIRKFQEQRRYENHSGMCESGDGANRYNITIEDLSYPSSLTIQEYIPSKICPVEDTGNISVPSIVSDYDLVELPTTSSNPITVTESSANGSTQNDTSKPGSVVKWIFMWWYVVMGSIILVGILLFVAFKHKKLVYWNWRSSSYSRQGEDEEVTREDSMPLTELPKYD